jgi:hypothetical protein
MTFVAGARINCPTVADGLNRVTSVNFHAFGLAGQGERAGIVACRGLWRGLNWLYELGAILQAL